jgi:hypothetical protein
MRPAAGGPGGLHQRTHRGEGRERSGDEVGIVFYL